MIMLGKHSLLHGNPTHSSSVSSSCLLHVDPSRSARHSVVRLLWYLVPLLQQSVPSRRLPVLNNPCAATMFAVCLLSDPNGPPTAFLLFRPQCPVGVLAGTHWGALRCPGRMQSGTKRQTLSAALLHCCCTAEPVLTRVLQTSKKVQKRKKSKK